MFAHPETTAFLRIPQRDDMLEGGSCRLEGLSVDWTRIGGVSRHELYNHLSNVGILRNHLNCPITPEYDQDRNTPTPWKHNVFQDPSTGRCVERNRRNAL